ncbi:expressed unknown protein [Seminavis robusta]|uniref:Uncharacterized protein n=1 Tax=Seminavis robusta TaxID=568900 RepID=A0A9N8ED80_9STRA|nr:expressed unknown protein [Seminavis robusta]|eukprot:Sro907_g218730.1 n/a (528) ;mRNA; f:10212-11795
MNPTKLITDYLVVGAGAASMAFVDTILAEQPNATVSIVDKHNAPGGHWNDAYGFVRLHQPTLLYGVASKQMEGTWLKLCLRGVLPWQHRASKEEILAHYKLLMDQWVASGRVKYYPHCTYQFDQTEGNIHSFVENATKTTRSIEVRKKLVNGVLGECRVPSQTPPQFHVDKGVPIVTPNQIFDDHLANKKNRSGRKHKNKVDSDKRYVVLGCGKTALDTVVFLQQKMKVSARNIAWVAPNDIWMLRRSGPGSPWSWGDALLKCNGDPDKAGMMLEEQEVFARLTHAVKPTRFRFPVIGDEELEIAQKVKDMIRRGRVTAIEKLPNGSCKVSFTESEEPMIFGDNYTFVHCTSPGPFNDNHIRDVFPSENTINLLFLYAPPVPISMSSIASLESRLQNGTLDMDFARRLLMENKDGAQSSDDTDVLNAILGSYGISIFPEDKLEMAKHHMEPIKTLAVFLSILDKDPLVGHKWLKQNRLSFFSIPGFKGEVCENLHRMIEAKDNFRFSDEEVDKLKLLAEKLQPLQGM